MKFAWKSGVEILHGQHDHQKRALSKVGLGVRGCGWLRLAPHVRHLACGYPMRKIARYFGHSETVNLILMAMMSDVRHEKQEYQGIYNSTLVM